MGDVRLVLDNRGVVFTRGGFFVDIFNDDIEVDDILTQAFMQLFASFPIGIYPISKFFFYFFGIAR